MFHKLMHILGWNKGRVVSKVDACGDVWIGFRCECGRVEGWHKPTFCNFRLPGE